MKLSVKDFYEAYNGLLENHEEKMIYCVHDKTQVDYGYMNDCDLEWCEENNIPVFQFRRGGGCIVNSQGNITLIEMSRFKGQWRGSRMIKSFIKFLNDKGIDAKFSKNDVMIDGFKVASAVSRNLKPDYKWQIAGIQVSINQDMNVIEHACKKKMAKTPKGLSEFGITTEDVEQWINEYFSKSFNKRIFLKGRFKKQS